MSDVIDITTRKEYEPETTPIGRDIFEKATRMLNEKTTTGVAICLYHADNTYSIFFDSDETNTTMIGLLEVAVHELLKKIDADNGEA